MAVREHSQDAVICRSHEYFGIRLEGVWRVVERDRAARKAEVRGVKRALA